MVEIEWSGKYSKLCEGQWYLYVNGEDFSHKIPENYRKLPMNTYGVYTFVSLDDDGEETYKSYYDGLYFDEWLIANPWVKHIPASPLDIYEGFKEKDWRFFSCGGCL